MLVISEVSKRFGSLQALHGVSFTARSGRILGFLGPNGAGKTTAMRCILGLLPPDSGHITWDDRPIDPGVRLSFGYMPEQRGLYPKMQIEAQLTYLARLSGMDSAAAQTAARTWLERLGLAERGKDKLEALSHGNQQRVQLAAALVHNPTLAVLDEPFSGLDPIGVKAMTTQLRDLAAAGTTILFSSHQLELVEEVCDDVVIINDGAVVADGTLAELRQSAARRRLAVEVDGQPWTPPDEIVSTPTAGGYVLVERDTRVGDVLALAQQAGTVTAFSFEPPTLNDVFHEAVAP